MARINQAANINHATASAVYKAFGDTRAMELWLPLEGMTGRMRSEEGQLLLCAGKRQDFTPLPFKQ